MPYPHENTLKKYLGGVHATYSRERWQGVDPSLKKVLAKKNLSKLTEAELATLKEFINDKNKSNIDDATLLAQFNSILDNYIIEKNISNSNCQPLTSYYLKVLKRKNRPVNEIFDELVDELEREKKLPQKSMDDGKDYYWVTSFFSSLNKFEKNDGQESKIWAADLLKELIGLIKKHVRDNKTSAKEFDSLRIMLAFANSYNVPYLNSPSSLKKNLPDILNTWKRYIKEASREQKEFHDGKTNQRIEEQRQHSKQRMELHIALRENKDPELASAIKKYMANNEYDAFDARGLLSLTPDELDLLHDMLVQPNFKEIFTQEMFDQLKNDVIRNEENRRLEKERLIKEIKDNFFKSKSYTKLNTYLETKSKEGSLDDLHQKGLGVLNAVKDEINQGTLVKEQVSLAYKILDSTLIAMKSPESNENLKTYRSLVANAEGKFGRQEKLRFAISVFAFALAATVFTACVIGACLIPGAAPVLGLFAFTLAIGVMTAGSLSPFFYLDSKEK